MPAIFNWLSRFVPETPLRKVANVRQQNRIANILEDIQGIGCRILKPTDREGLGWRIMLDGSSDVEPPADTYLAWDEQYSWRLTLESFDIASITSGTLYWRREAQTITDYTGTIDFSTNTHFYITVDRSGATPTFTWTEGTSFPEATSTLSYIPIYEFTEAGNFRSVIYRANNDIWIADEYLDDITIEEDTNGKLQFKDWDAAVTDNAPYKKSDGTMIYRIPASGISDDFITDIDGLTSQPSVGNSYSTITWQSRGITIADGTITVQAASPATTVYGDITVHFDDIQGSLKHSVLDYTNGVSIPAGAVDNKDHDNRYWFAFGTNGGAEGDGVDSKNYHTTGECHANVFEIQDKSTNYWSSSNFSVDTTTEVSIRSTGNITIAPAFEPETTLATDLRFGESTRVFEYVSIYGEIIEAYKTKACYFHPPSDGIALSDFEIGANGLPYDDIKIYSQSTLNILGYGGSTVANIGAGGQSTNEFATINVKSSGDINLTSAGDLNLGVAAANINYNGNAGLDTYGHTKGGFTDEAAFEAAIETKVNDILAGHGLI